MNTLTIVGLGPGSKNYLTLEALDVLLTGETVYVRTMKHPVIDDLIEKGAKFSGLDHHYETQNTFEEVYEAIANEVLMHLKEGDVTYAVPGNPFVAESTVERLLEIVDDEHLKIVHGASFIDAIVTTLRIDPVYGLKIMDGLTIEDMVPDVNSDALVIQVYDQQVASNVKIKLMAYYSDDHEVTVVRGAGIPGEEVVLTVLLYELDRVDCLDHLTSVYINAVHPEDRDRYFMQDLEQVMTILRSPEGCPWDREQSHESLKKYLIEEAYEVIDAIDSGDLWSLEEELGDLLLQVVFHSEIARENGYFNMTDVITGIYEKMVRRHPHVFSDVDVTGSDEVLVNWDNIKNDEKAEETISDEIDHIAALPPLMKAEKIFKKMAKAGFDYDSVEGALDKIHEELEELKADIKESHSERIFNEYGDLLGAVVDLGRKLSLDPSEALLKTLSKITRRFRFVEESLLAENKSMTDVSLKIMEDLWEKSKKHDI
ncbi:MAG: nucleoside triphosphate pyrophosphohydrolase [Clostridia bacterium]|nr:nucleoside triphosphate pyrophosphohydrolase [Clostridia bacterium]